MVATASLTCWRRPSASRRDTWLSSSFADVAAGVERKRGDLLHHLLELSVAGDEVGLRVHLDDGAGLNLRHDADEALCGNAIGLLGGLREALLAQQVDGRFHVAVGLRKRLLAIHHAGAGLVAQLLHGRGGNRGHDSPFALRGEFIR